LERHGRRLAASPLPDAVKVCRVIYEKERGDGPVGDVTKIDCR
jgi:hypothetical protein